MRRRDARRRHSRWRADPDTGPLSNPVRSLTVRALPLRRGRRRRPATSVGRGASRTTSRSQKSPRVAGNVTTFRIRARYGLDLGPRCTPEFDCSPQGPRTASAFRASTFSTGRRQRSRYSTRLRTCAIRELDGGDGNDDVARRTAASTSLVGGTGKDHARRLSDERSGSRWTAAATRATASQMSTARRSADDRHRLRDDLSNLRANPSAVG